MGTIHVLETFYFPGLMAIFQTCQSMPETEQYNSDIKLMMSNIYRPTLGEGKGCSSVSFEIGWECVTLAFEIYFKYFTKKIQKKYFVGEDL